MFWSLSLSLPSISPPATLLTFLPILSNSPISPSCYSFKFSLLHPHYRSELANLYQLTTPFMRLKHLKILYKLCSFPCYSVLLEASSRFISFALCHIFAFYWNFIFSLLTVYSESLFPSVLVEKFTSRKHCGCCHTETELAVGVHVAGIKCCASAASKCCRCGFW